MDNKNIYELNDEELDQIAGGAAFINANTNRVVFDASKQMFKFQNCTYIDVRNLCESFIGKYETELEYDNACIAALKAKGWI